MGLNAHSWSVVRFLHHAINIAPICAHAHLMRNEIASVNIQSVWCARCDNAGQVRAICGRTHKLFVPTNAHIKHTQTYAHANSLGLIWGLTECGD